MKSGAELKIQSRPILLFDGECAVCRSIARWVQQSTQSTSSESSIIVRPIGDDPDELRSLNPQLDIWDAYATIHVLMPDGSMKLGGEAVAEVLRNVPSTKWFAGIFNMSILGIRPFAMILSVGYTILADVRPLLGCESCGAPARWLKPVEWTIARAKVFAAKRDPAPTPHFTSSTAHVVDVR